MEPIMEPISRFPMGPNWKKKNPQIDGKNVAYFCRPLSASKTIQENSLG
jgi:hypothetical protein